MTHKSRAGGLTTKLAGTVLASLATGFAATGLGLGQEALPETSINVLGGFGGVPQATILEEWAAETESESGGAIQVQVRPWTELGLKGPEVLNLVQQGAYDAGFQPFGYNSGDYPLNDAIDLAGQSPTIEVLKEVVEAFRPTISSFYESSLGLKILGIAPYPPQVTFCTKPIESLDDFAGRKIRTSTASQAEFVRSLGATEINMSSAEVQTALLTGVIDCGITGGGGAYRSDWAAGAKYFYPLPINWQVSATIYNLGLWEELDPSVQNFLQERAKVLEDQLWSQAELEQDTSESCLTGNGDCPEGPPADMIMVEVKETDRARLAQIFEEQIFNNWTGRCGEDCAQTWRDTIGKISGIAGKKGE